MFHRSFGLAVSLLAFGGVSSLANAAVSVVAVDFTDGGSEGSSAQTRGFSFYTSNTISVTAVGWYDSAKDGLTDSHQVGIWNSVGTQVLGGTVAAGVANALTGLFRYTTTLTGITTLTPGTYVIGGLSTSNDPTYRSIAAGSVTFAPGLTYNGSTTNSTIDFFSEPTVFTPDFDIGYFGPNFQIATPEPTACAIVSLAAVVAASSRRRTKA